MMERIQDSRRVILIVIVALLLVCLLAVLAINVFFSPGGGDDVAGPPPTATPVPTEEEAADITTPEEEDLTPTPTRVVSGGVAETPLAEATTEATTEAAPGPTAQPTATPTAAAAAAETSTSAPIIRVIEVPDLSQIDDTLRNGGFEEGFDERGVGLHWKSFQNDGTNFAFSEETAPPFVQAGQSAQRVSVEFAVEPDRFGGIYQTAEVVPGEVYTLTLYGQIRTGFGDVIASSYGYRLQYGIDYKGGQSWQSIPANEWVELPWGEQLITGSEFEFSEFTTQITPTSDELTLFIRTWNKWPIQSLVEYTFDSISLVGPIPGKVMLVTVETGVETGSGTAMAAGGTETGTGAETTAPPEAMIDQPLPVTGIGGSANLMADGRFWGGILVLLLLGAGAVYRAKWRW
jgi:hypothetical protein